VKIGRDKGGTPKRKQSQSKVVRKICILNMLRFSWASAKPPQTAVLRGLTLLSAPIESSHIQDAKSDISHLFDNLQLFRAQE
jgi:hypothetical protein